MAKQCVFCDREANSKEHLWPDWILERLGKDQPTRRKIGKAIPKIVPNSVLEIRCVCISCNNGWMSALEKENIPLIGSLMQDIAAPLDESQQTLLSIWALKTAMVLDSVNAKERGHYYTRAECEALRLNRTIPDHTNVWIGAYSREGYSADGTILSLDLPSAPKAAKASLSTFVVGHLPIQVITIRPEPQHNNTRIEEVKIRPGQWDKLLLSIWPVEKRSIMWPPPLTFNNSGPQSIATLFARWRLGKQV